MVSVRCGSAAIDIISAQRSFNCKMRLWKNRSKMRTSIKSSSSSTRARRFAPFSGTQMKHFMLVGILIISIASNHHTVATGSYDVRPNDFTSAVDTSSSASSSSSVVYGYSSPASAASTSAVLPYSVSSSSAMSASYPSMSGMASTLPEAAALSATAALIEPYVDSYTPTNVTTQIGTHAYLPCRVKQLGNKSVSWIRVRDGHILTVDRAVFIADQRFLALKQPDKYWTLQIKYVQARDAGAYECQVSTEPKVSARVHLQVVVPRTEILGEPDRYVKAGSNVVLRCIVRGALEPPTFIMWYHGTEQLSADSRRHRTQMDPNLPEANSESQSTIGSLIIESAKKRDTGNYTCSPSNSPSATVTLNIINGESSASAVTSSATVTRAYTLCILKALLFSVILAGGHRT